MRSMIFYVSAVGIALSGCGKSVQKDGQPGMNPELTNALGAPRGGCVDTVVPPAAKPITAADVLRPSGAYVLQDFTFVGAGTLNSGVPNAPGGIAIVQGAQAITSGAANPTGPLSASPTCMDVAALAGRPLRWEARVPRLISAVDGKISEEVRYAQDPAHTDPRASAPEAVPASRGCGSLAEFLSGGTNCAPGTAVQTSDATIVLFREIAPYQDPSGVQVRVKAMATYVYLPGTSAVPVPAVPAAIPATVPVPGVRIPEKKHRVPVTADAVPSPAWKRYPAPGSETVPSPAWKRYPAPASSSVTSSVPTSPRQGPSRYIPAGVVKKDPCAAPTCSVTPTTAAPVTSIPASTSVPSGIVTDVRARGKFKWDQKHVVREAGTTTKDKQSGIAKARIDGAEIETKAKGDAKHVVSYPGSAYDLEKSSYVVKADTNAATGAYDRKVKLADKAVSSSPDAVWKEKERSKEKERGDGDGSSERKLKSDTKTKLETEDLNLKATAHVTEKSQVDAGTGESETKLKASEAFLLETATSSVKDKTRVKAKAKHFRR